jgi:hypothetical protein
LQPLAVSYVSNDLRTQTLPGAAAAYGVGSGDLQRDLTSSSRGDMINIQLKIIGDPQLIKQDDLFYAQNISPPTSQFTPNNSLYYDGGELYVNVIFQSPIDYDESTGLAIPNLGIYNYNLFNGIYKIITVDNIFRQGKFEQTLNLIRLPVNAQDINQLINARARIETYVNYGLGQLAGLPYSRFTGPRILVNNLAAGAGIYNAGVAGSGGGLPGLVGGIVNQFVGKVSNELISKATGAIKDIFSSSPLTGIALDTEFQRVSDIALNSGADIIDSNELFNTIEAGDIPAEFLNLPEVEFDPDFGNNFNDFFG